MEGIKERYATFLEAFTSRRVLVFSSILAVASAIYHYVPKISWWDASMILGILPIGLAFIVALLLGVAVLFEYAHRKRMETVPKFKPSFDQNSGGIVQTPTKIIREVDNRVEQIDSHGAYVRVKVENLSKVAIRECFAFVTAISKKDHKTGLFSALPLDFSVSITPLFNLYPEIPHFISFLQVGESDNEPILSGPWPLALKNAFSDETLYRFTISVVVAGITKTQQVEVSHLGLDEALLGDNSRYA